MLPNMTEYRALIECVDPLTVTSSALTFSRVYTEALGPTSRPWAMPRPTLPSQFLNLFGFSFFFLKGLFRPLTLRSPVGQAGLGFRV